MAEFPIYIETHADETCIHWLDADGTPQHGSLGEAADAAAQRDVLVLVPAETILLTTVALPPIRQSSRRLNAASYALEEQLVAQIDTLHFVLADKPKTRGQASAVAVTDLERMRALMATLADAGIHVTRMAPDVLALPAPEAGTWQACTLNERILVRTGTTTGFACDQEVWSAFAGGAENAIERIIVQTDRDQGLALPAADIPGAPALDILPPTTHASLVASLLGNADTRLSVNLCQGEFARASNIRHWWQPFKATAALVALWLVLVLVDRGLAIHQAQQRISTLHQQTVTAFHAAFPQVQTINNLRVQAQQSMAALRDHGDAAGIYDLLQATALATNASAGIQVQTLRYRNGKLILGLKGDNVQALEALRAEFKRQSSVKMTVERADAAGDGVQIRAAVSSAQTT